MNVWFNDCSIQLNKSVRILVLTWCDSYSKSKKGCSMPRKILDNWKIPIWTMSWRFFVAFNTLRPRLNGQHFPHDIFKCIFLSENVWIPITIRLKFVPKGPINYITALVPITARHWPGDKPLSEPMMVRFPTHICLTRPQWVNIYFSVIAFSVAKYAEVQYIPRNMHTVLLCFALLWLCNRS